MRNEHLLSNYVASMHTVRATIDFQVSAPKSGSHKQLLLLLLLLLLLISGLR